MNTNHVKVLDLPLRLRLRFWWTHQVNGVAIWFADHGHPEAAIRVWRICRMW